MISKPNPTTADDDTRSDALSSNASDNAALALRLGGTAASLGGPVLGIIGPIAAELLNNIIPNQRQDRIVRFLTTLDAKVTDIDRRLLDQQVRNERFVDVIEDGMHQSVRALSQERLEYIAAILANGLKEGDIAYTRTKWMLWLLGQLNDAEIIILKYHAHRLNNEIKREFYEKHKDVLTPPAPVIGSAREDVDKNAFHRSYINHMVGLGLMNRKYKVPKKGEAPQFDDNTGTLKPGSPEITYLGRLLLRHIDQLPNDTGGAEPPEE